MVENGIKGTKNIHTPRVFSIFCDLEKKKLDKRDAK
jgi:hypothetical protein